MRSFDKRNNAFISILERFGECSRVVFARGTGPLVGGMKLESSSLLVFLLSGKQQISSYRDGRRVDYLMTAGELFFIPAGHPYALNWLYDCRRVGIVASEFKQLSISWNNHTSGCSRMVERPDLWYSASLREDNDLFALFSAMTGRLTWPEDSPVTCELGKLIIRRIIEHLEAHQISEAMRSASHTFQKISSYLEANCHRQISRKELADIFKLHPDYVSRLFKNFARCGFSEYLRHLRMLNAEWYLLHSEMSIGGIAETCGFYDASYFIKIFRAKHRMPPGEYRTGRGNGFISPILSRGGENAAIP